MDRFRKRSLSDSSYSLHNSPIAIEDADAAVETGAGEGDVHVPKPLDCLQGTPIPPFLSKTYDLVDDMRLDMIISWSDTGASFVVWDPVEFSRRILPKNFKHNNFSSFVRQLNTYGFRKIDTDRWEFACESFVRGKRHLLKNIRRRKSLPAQHLSEESSSLSVEAEVDRLHKEKAELMQEVIYLQHQQRGTHQYMESINEKLQAAEDRQKQMISSLAKVFQTQKFKKDTRRKVLETNPVPVDSNDTTIRDLDIQSKIVPLQLPDHDLQDLARVNDPFVPHEEPDFNFCFDATSMVKQEDIWSGEFDTVSAMPNRMWVDVGDFGYPESGFPGGGELAEFWNVADSSGEASQSWKTNHYGF